MKPTPGLDPESDRDVEALLHGMQDSAPRDPQKAARAREAFLAEARSMAPRVSNLPAGRLNRWQERFGAFGLLTRREKRPVFNAVMTVLLVLGALFGGGATAVVASQNAQPDNPLYFAKTLSEDVRMDVQTDPQVKLNLALEYTARRLAETQTMLAAGRAAPESLMRRFENQLQQALMIAAGMQEGEGLAALERVRDQARAQEQMMSQLQLPTDATLQTRARVKTMLQAQELLAQAGIDDPNWLRQQLHQGNGNQTMRGNPPAESPGAPDSAPGNVQPSTNGERMPDSGYGPGTSESPVPGGGYGPGPGTNDCADCTTQPMDGGSGGGAGGGKGSEGGGRGSGMGGNGGSMGPWPTPTPSTQE